LKSLVVIRVFKDKKLVEVKQFTEAQIVLGHNAEVQVDLDDIAVSPIHCMIELRDSGYYICDLGSQTGTFKNGHRILDDSLNSGDEIQVGPFTVSFFVGTPKPKPSDPVRNEVVIDAPSAIPAEKVKVATIPSSLPIAESAIEVRRPEIRKSSSSSSHLSTSVQSPFKKRQKGQKTFAPHSPFSDLRGHLRPGKGGLVEVLVSWKERIINTQHLRGKKSYSIGSFSGCDIVLPSDSFGKIWGFVQIDVGVLVKIPPGAVCEIITPQGIKNLEESGVKVQRTGTSLNIRLDQNEIISIKFIDSDVEVFVRFSPHGPAVPLIPPFLLSTSELTGFLMSVVLVALLWLWVTATKPIPSIEDTKEDDRIAKVIFEMPKLKIPPPPPAPPPKEEPKPPPAVIKEPIKVKVADKTQEQQTKGKQAEAAKEKLIAKKAAEVVPIPNSKNRPKIFTSSKQGGAFKQNDVGGANADSAKPKDLSKVGLLSAFGGGGHRSKLDQAYSGAGDVLGSADKANGNAGFKEDRPGDDIGSKFKDVGAGGKGTQTEGIGGIGTKGRSSGQSAYGSVNGFGNKSSVIIDAGGSDQDFVGTIDKEAVRRVIRARLNEIRGCYERELSRLPKGSKLEGKVVLAWEIVQKGVAQNVVVKSSTLGNSSVESCIRSRLASWTFPEPPQGMIAEVESFPFVLKASE